MTQVLVVGTAATAIGKIALLPVAGCLDQMVTAGALAVATLLAARAAATFAIDQQNAQQHEELENGEGVHNRRQRNQTSRALVVVQDKPSQTGARPRQVSQTKQKSETADHDARLASFRAQMQQQKQQVHSKQRNPNGTKEAQSRRGGFVVEQRRGYNKGDETHGNAKNAATRRAIKEHIERVSVHFSLAMIARCPLNAQFDKSQVEMS